MQAGKIYNDFDPDLFNRRVEAKKLFRAYNQTEDSEVEKRKDIMQKLFKSVGKNVWIEPDFRCEFGKNITIGNDAYINFGCVQMSEYSLAIIQPMPKNVRQVDLSPNLSP